MVAPSFVSTVTVQPQPAKQSRSTPLSKHLMRVKVGVKVGVRGQVT
jgi:hypothetical protein